jgi:hypothetical protein
LETHRAHPMPRSRSSPSRGAPSGFDAYVFLWLWFGGLGVINIGLAIRNICGRTRWSRSSKPKRPSKLDPFAEKLTGWLRQEAGKVLVGAEAGSFDLVGDGT